jgi:hypothetical protein
MNRRALLHLSGAALAGAPFPTATAIQGVCAWPNLQRLGDGSLVATIFNQPCHGAWEGDLDCWASDDGGKRWRFRGRAAAHEPATARMNCAVGIARNRDLVVLVSGWNKRNPPGQPTSATLGKVLRPWVCRSRDGGRTWSQDGAFPEPEAAGLGIDNNYVPFGDLRLADNGDLCAAAYLRRDNKRACHFFRSSDDGVNWKRTAVLNPVGNETAPLHLGRGRWLAASRTFATGPDVHIDLCTSSDDGRTWTREQALTQPGQITGHLARLANGHVLLSYGNRNRNNYGVDARISEDAGKTWGPPFRIAACPQPDCGYPSTVQLADGSLVTAYYTRIGEDYHYEMRVAHWRP